MDGPEEDLHVLSVPQPPKGMMEGSLFPAQITQVCPSIYIQGVH